MLEYLTADELDYLANAPSSIEPEILGSMKLKNHASEIVFLKGLPQQYRTCYLEAKRKIQELIRSDTEHKEFLLDLSESGLTQLPPELHILPRRAKYFYLDLSSNHFESYYVIRNAITHSKTNHPIPFDAINLEGNPLKDVPVDIIERGKFSTENIEKYWMKHWAKPYTLSARITDVVREHRFNDVEIGRLMELLQSALPNQSKEQATAKKSGIRDTAVPQSL